METLRSDPRQRRKLLFVLLVAVHAVLVIVFFDTKVDIGGDDADYIVAALDFKDKIAFPSWHGSFYPIVLSPQIALFGIDLLLLKLLSVAFTALSIFVLCKTIRPRVSDHVFYCAFALICCNASIAFYGSTTYSEPLFLLLQSLVIYSFFKLEDDSQLRVTAWLAFITVVFLLSITRNIGWGAWIALVMFYIKGKQYRKVVLLSAGFLALHFAFILYKNYAWEISEIGVEGQFGRIAYKNFYNAAEGTEDTLGFCVRFWQNSQLYLSKHLAILLGLRGSAAVEPSSILTVLMYLLFAVSIVRSWRSNSPFLFPGIYTGTLLAVTFITQQVHWDQQRLILVYFPIIAVLIADLLSGFSKSKIKLLRNTASILIVLLPLLTFVRSMKAATVTLKKAQTASNTKFSGYPEEWENYAMVSEWAGKNIDDSLKILCRKQGISTIYGRRRFIGLTRYTDTIPSHADAFLLDRKIRHVIVDDVNMPTVRRLMKIYLREHPLGLKTIYTHGNLHPSSLMLIDRSDPKDDRDYFQRVKAGILLYPDEPHYYTMAGDRYYLMKNYEQAANLYSIALRYTKNSSESVRILWNVAVANLQNGKVHDARRAAEMALKMKPGDSQLSGLIGYIDKMDNSKKRF